MNATSSAVYTQLHPRLHTAPSPSTTEPWHFQRQQYMVRFSRGLVLRHGRVFPPCQSQWHQSRQQFQDESSSQRECTYVGRPQTICWNSKGILPDTIPGEAGIPLQMILSSPPFCAIGFGLSSVNRHSSKARLSSTDSRCIYSPSPCTDTDENLMCIAPMAVSKAMIRSEISRFSIRTTSKYCCLGIWTICLNF